MSNADRSRVIHLADARTSVPGPGGEHAVTVFQRGGLNAWVALGRFAPRDPLRPPSAHTRDEVYVILSGRGVLLHDGKRDLFEAGDLLFVAAGVEHRFEDFTDDLVVWILFHGPEGGEVPA
jgi:mannose-6-phosphate isomerase-like protein (cupin superfamily)